jgi:hypothetical protein
MLQTTPTAAAAAAAVAVTNGRRTVIGSLLLDTDKEKPSIPAKGMDAVAADDLDMINTAFVSLIRLHTNDEPCETAVAISYGAEHKPVLYELYAFGYRNTITLDELQQLRDDIAKQQKQLHQVVELGISFDVLGERQQPEWSHGAVIVRLSSTLACQQRALNISTEQLSMKRAAAASVVYEEETPKRFRLWPGWMT